MTTSMDDIQNQVILEMQFLDDWFDQYDYLINAGKQLDPLDNQYKSEEFQTPGCQSAVWIYPNHSDGIITFQAESDSAIIKGMLALILRVVNHQSPRNIINTPLFFIDKTGLKSHLSPSRSNGLQAIIKHIHSICETSMKQ